MYTFHSALHLIYKKLYSSLWINDIVDGNKKRVYKRIVLAFHLQVVYHSMATITFTNGLQKMVWLCWNTMANNEDLYNCVALANPNQTTPKSLIHDASNPKTEMFLVSPCSCLCTIHQSQLLSRLWICSWSSADRRCSQLRVSDQQLYCLIICGLY